MRYEAGSKNRRWAGMAPGDYRKGRDSLRVRPEIDKARYGRTIPISEAATEALDSVYPEDGGLLFGVVDYRTLLQRAGADAGLLSVTACQGRHAHGRRMGTWDRHP